MFGRKKTEPEPSEAGPYLVEVVSGDKQLQALLNKRHSEGYDLAWLYQLEMLGSSQRHHVVFKKRD